MVCSTKRAACLSLRIAIRRFRFPFSSPAAATVCCGTIPAWAASNWAVRKRAGSPMHAIDGIRCHHRRKLRGNYGALRGFTGHPPVLPEFAAGFWQCKLRYKTQDELLAVAREHKRRGLPMSVIVIDYFNWTKMGEWKFDPVLLARSEGDGGRIEIARYQSHGLRLADGESRQRTFRGTGKEKFAGPRRARYEHFIRFTDTNANHTVISGLLDTTNPDARKFFGAKCAKIIFATASESSGSTPLSRKWRLTTTTTCVIKRARPRSRLHLSHATTAGVF